MTSTLLRASAVALLVAGALPGCAAFPHSSNLPVDQKITTGIEARFNQHADLDASNSLEVQTISGVVYLHGVVSTDLQRRDTELVAMDSQGVQKVVNLIWVAQ